MKCKIATIALTLCLVCCLACPLTVYGAENQTGATTSVLYTIQGGYTVNIPASVNLNNEENIIITASELSLPSGKDLVVRLNPDSFDEAGIFYLSENGGAKISCDITCGNIGGVTSSYIRAADCLNSAVVARFNSTSRQESGAYQPSELGLIGFSLNTPGLVAGEYSASLSFIIGLEAHSQS